MSFAMISKSGRAPMMEAAYSLIQLAKPSVKSLYISLYTDPATGQTTATYTMLRDSNISELAALI
jgi:acetyl-CoA carboxylase carboxyl transferase subunit beta